MTDYINAITQVSITIAAGTSNTATVNVTSANSFPIFQGCSTTGTGADGATGSPRITFSISSGVMTITATLNSAGSCVVNCVVIDPTANLVTAVTAGTITVAGATSNTATGLTLSTTLSSVFYLGQTTTATNRATWGQTVATNLAITSSSVITATLSAAGTVTVSYVAVTWAAGALNSNVQQFSTTKNTQTSNTQAITSVSKANSILAWGGYSTTASAFTGVPYINQTSPTVVTLTSNAAATYTCNFTVIEFVPGVLKSNQEGNVAISASTSGATTPGTAVVAANSACVYLGQTGAGTTDATTNTRITLTNGTPTVTANVTTSSSPTAGFGLYEFFPATTPNVQTEYPDFVLSALRERDYSGYDMLVDLPDQSVNKLQWQPRYDDTARGPINREYQWQHVEGFTVDLPDQNVSRFEWNPDLPDFATAAKRTYYDTQQQYTDDEFKRVPFFGWHPAFPDRAPGPQRGALYSTYEFYSPDEALRLAQYNWRPSFPDRATAAPRGALYATYQFYSPDESLREAKYGWEPEYPDSAAAAKRGALYATYQFYTDDEAIRQARYNWEPEYPDTAIRARWNYDATPSDEAFVHALPQANSFNVAAWQFEGPTLPPRKLPVQVNPVFVFTPPTPTAFYADAWQFDATQIVRRQPNYQTQGGYTPDEALREAKYGWQPSFPDIVRAAKRAYYEGGTFYLNDQALRLTAYAWRPQYPDFIFRKSTAALLDAGGAQPIIVTVGTTGEIKFWNGAAFVAKPVKVWTGAAWVVKPLKYWNGASWVVTPY